MPDSLLTAALAAEASELAGIARSPTEALS